MGDKELKIVFEPGCFDSFDGTQEELDSLVIEIQRLVESGEILENSTILTDEDMPEWVADMLVSDDADDRKRKLN